MVLQAFILLLARVKLDPQLLFFLFVNIMLHQLFLLERLAIQGVHQLFVGLLENSVLFAHALDLAREFQSFQLRFFPYLEQLFFQGNSFGLASAVFLSHRPKALFHVFHVLERGLKLALQHFVDLRRFFKLLHQVIEPRLLLLVMLLQKQLLLLQA